ncbi:dihydrolipoyllysine-residue acetyltransferase component of pyruvate dehydrogenase complex, mitochondrial-like [Aethina tumida]|uniref:dihydrolipoyllysine-residue acetyltransferase component of pyruvate dehydrogenase complex, mitochondrial-like n=1 Tax=Aethina tumida TaxID=116153 RepID=UPI00214932C7|nr:dihydrolipoyllysine-residue acetyltransferase component of pyruvate dehydrogenase complex, mitochondrial-like [Aethina tumida]
MVLQYLHKQYYRPFYTYCEKTVVHHDFFDFPKRYFSNLPPFTRINLPALSPTMEEGGVASWVKKEGDKISPGDVLAEIETDKATMGFESQQDGYLAKIIIPAGTKNIPVGKLLCIIVDNQADVAKFKDFKDDTPVPKADAPPPSPPVERITATVPKRDSPMASRLAELSKSRKADETALEKILPPELSTPNFSDIPLSNFRKISANKFLESKTTTPHYYLSIDCLLNKVMRTRQKLNEELRNKRIELTINEFIVKAVAIASIKIPEVNSFWHESFIRQYGEVDVNWAITTEKGLLTPVVLQANKKSLPEISEALKTLAEKAKQGLLTPQECNGGTICVSNLSMYDVNRYYAIINPPQSTIVSVGAIDETVGLDSNGKMQPIELVTVHLSCDHRVVDGAVAAQWIQVFKSCIENPEQLLP